MLLLWGGSASALLLQATDETVNITSAFGACISPAGECSSTSKFTFTPVNSSGEQTGDEIITDNFGTADLGIGTTFTVAWSPDGLLAPVEPSIVVPVQDSANFIYVLFANTNAVSFTTALAIDAKVVPIPPAALLFGSALVALVAVARRRRKPLSDTQPELVLSNQ